MIASSVVHLSSIGYTERAYVRNGLEGLTVAAVPIGAAVPGGRGRVPLGVDDPVRRPSFCRTEEESSASDEESEECGMDGGASRAARVDGHGLAQCAPRG
jgi:hypothetical protein